ncbi:hypothetical protein CUN63_03310 [Pseudomonas sp. ACM7]|nr:hypothetical protein CUN63_03310 [Pseudomonas sp. ACM7]
MSLKTCWNAGQLSHNPLWERACSRKRCIRQHQCRLRLPLREQARSHRILARFKIVYCPIFDLFV